ncbi:WD repeat-containing protein 54-like [Penaeus vannamei]|uniref:WD repeat-containing protein 54-like n=1 Tax=Penaeus vannamei TaxID=6689 RepID=UPI00387F4A6F
MYEREKTVMLATSASLLPNNLCRVRRNGKVWAGVVHRDRLNIVCASDPEGEPRQIAANIGSSVTANILQAAWVTLHGRELLVLATAAGVLVYEWDGSVLLHAHLLPTPPADASSSFTRGIAALYSGVICVGVHTGEILSLPVTEEGTVGEGEKVRYHARPVTALAAHGLILVSADDQGTIVVAEDVEGLRKMCLIETYNETAVTCLKAWAGQIVAGYLSGHIRIFNLHDGRIQAEVCAHVRSVSGLDVAVESGLLISASEDTFVRVWQLGKIDVPIEHKYSFSERDTTICGVTFTDDLGAGYLTTGYDRLDLLCYAM